MPTLIELSSGRLTATLNPAGGGTVASFQVDRRGRVDDLLRRAGAEAVESGDPLGASCFPLVPFFGFVRSGHIPIAGNERPMAANHASESFPIHGDGWLAPWEVTDAEGDRTTLAYVHDGARGTPYPYRATLGFALSETGLSVEVAVRNTGPEAVPAGLGLHPYFPKTADVELRVRATGAWPEPPDPEPMGARPVPPEWDLSAGRRLGDLELDHCFGGWDGRATVTWPDRRLALDLAADPPLGIFCVWSPRGEDFFCAEPVIPTVIDQNPCAHLRMPRDMIFHGWSMRLFQAWQHSATMSS